MTRSRSRDLSPRLAALGIATCLALPASAAAERSSLFGVSPLQAARQASAVGQRPPTRYRVPGGQLRVNPAELLASVPGQRITFSLSLDRTVAGAALVVQLPASWSRTPPSGIPYVRQPRLTRGLGGRAGLRRSGRDVRLAITRGSAGERAAFAVVNVGLPAGTYRLPLSWVDASGHRSAAGTARIVLYAPSREGGDGELTRLTPPGIEDNITSDAFEESESFIAATPSNKDRVALGINWDGGSMPAWITTNGGTSWTRRILPQTFSVKTGQSTPTSGETICCDPMLAANTAGDIWFGGLAFSDDEGTDTGPIVVNRIASSGTTMQTNSVAIPARVNFTQDKPLMTIDNRTSGAGAGRLYVVWNEPGAGGGINIVVSTCDTIVSSAAHPENCDDANHWSDPVDVTPGEGSYIYADVAVGPDGKVYVTWWDFSSANAIMGSVCDPSSAHDCTTAAGWSAPQTIALLDSTGGVPVPFACPILAQPGGRDAPEPQIAIDTSGGSQNGRVYVTWGDLRAGSGTTRCAVNFANPNGTPPAATHMTWDTFVASASGALPGGSSPSASVGRRLLTDGEDGGQANSDDWFSAITVDHSNGQAWADFYSTRDDPSRRTTNFYTRSVTAAGGGLQLGPLNRVSGAASDYSTEPCCGFGNDYGDYTGITAAGGTVYPVWSDHRAGQSGEGYTFLGTPQAGVGPPVAITGGASGVGTSGATLAGLVNPNGAAAGFHFELGTTTAYGTQVPASDASGGSDTADHGVSEVISGLAPATTYHYRLVASGTGGVADGADATFTTASVAPPPPPPPPPPPASIAITGFKVAKSQKLKTVLKSGVTGKAGCTTACTLTFVLELDRSTARHLGIVKSRSRKPVVIGRLKLRLSAAGTKRFAVKLSAKAKRRLKRVRRVRVKLLTSAADGAGHSVRRPALTITIKR